MLIYYVDFRAKRLLRVRSVRLTKKVIYGRGKLPILRLVFQYDPA